MNSLLQTVARDEDMSWAKREQLALGRVPSRGEKSNMLTFICSMFAIDKCTNTFNLLVLSYFSSSFNSHCLFSDPPAPSPLPSRSRSSSVGESLGLGGGRPMRAVVSHPSSSNPKLLPFSRGETIIVLVQEPRNGWLYGRTDSSLRWVH